MKDHSTTKFSSLLVGLVLVAVHFVVFWLVIFFLVKVVPIYSAYFEEMGFELPALTRWVLTLSEFAVSMWFAVLVPLFFFVDIPFLIVTSLLRPAHRWIRACWFVGWLVAAIILFAVGSLALSMPLAFAS